MFCFAAQVCSPKISYFKSKQGAVQDALKKSSKEELPDFYNIQLERPKDDPGGYDCLFIDAAAMVSCERT